MDVCIWRETDEELVAQIDGLRDEARKLEPRLVRRSTPAQRAHDLKALHWRFESLLADELTRLAAMLRQAGIRIDVEDGLVVGIVLR